MFSVPCYAAFELPTHAAQIQRVLAIPSKRFTRKLVSFLSRAEVDALLAAPERNTWSGRRDGYDAKQGVTWFTSILAFAEQHGRREIAEILLGNTLGTAGFHEDGAPTGQLTELLELVGSPRMEESVANTVGNALGAVRLPRGDAGRPYRDRVEFYRELEVRYRDSAPRTTRVVDLLRHRFEDQACLADYHERLDNRRDAHE